MTFSQVMKELESCGTAQTRKIYTNHGADIDMFGVSVANVKKIAKKNKNDHELGYKLFHSKNIDAIYTSQYVVDPERLTREDYDAVIDITNYYMILDNAVAPLIALNKPIAYDVLNEYIEHDNPRKRQIAYSLYGMMLSSYDNDDIDFNHVEKYIQVVKEKIGQEENRVKYSMNSFLIAAGAAKEDISPIAKDVAKAIGKVEVYMGKTACKVPDAFSYIEKIEKMGNVGKKRKLC